LYLDTIQTQNVSLRAVGSLTHPIQALFGFSDAVTEIMTYAMNDSANAQELTVKLSGKLEDVCCFCRNTINGSDLRH
jgi:hypothetical protein